MSIEDIKNEFIAEIDKLINGFASLEVLHIQKPNKSQLSEQTAISNLIIKLTQAKTEMSEAFDSYVDEYHCAISDFYTDQVYSFETSFRKMISDNLNNIRLRKATVVDSVELSALSIEVGFPHALASANASQEELKQKLQSLTEQFQIDFTTFKEPTCFIPTFVFFEQDTQSNARLNTRLTTIFKKAVQNISESHDVGIPHFSKRADEYLQFAKKTTQEVLTEANDAINKMYDAIAYKTKQIRIRNTEADLCKAVQNDFEKISQKVKTLLERITLQQEDDAINIVKEITELNPSIYSFQLPSNYTYYQDKINIIAGPINKLKGFHQAYSDKQIELAEKTEKAIVNKANEIKKMIVALNAENIDNRPAQIQRVLATIEQFLREIARIEKPKYLCSVRHTQQYEKIQRVLTEVRIDLEARKYNLNKILKMHTTVNNASLRFKDRERDAVSFFNSKKATAQLIQQSFEAFNQYDVAAFTKLENDLKNAGKPRKFELEYALFKSSRKALLRKAADNKQKSLESTKNYNKKRDDATLEKTKFLLLANSKLIELNEHANKISKDGNKGCAKAEKIKLLITNIENATTISELIDIIFGKSGIHVYTLSEINKSRSFFGFGEVTSSKYLKAFQENAKRIIDGDSPVKQVRFR